MRVLVTGGRHYRDRDHVFGSLDAIHDTASITLIIHGACGDDASAPKGPASYTGADRWADEWAHERGVPVQRCPADWSRGRKGGPERNARMLREQTPHMVVAFPGGDGTDGMVRLAIRALGGLFVVDLRKPGSEYMAHTPRRK